MTFYFKHAALSVIENDLDGEAISAAVQQGPETLKEVVPSLGKRLKIFAALNKLKSQDEVRLYVMCMLD